MKRSALKGFQLTILGALKGKPLQTQLQENMDRLLGARKQDARGLLKEEEPAKVSNSLNPRGPIREEIPMGIGSEASS